jgi:hypothetical protein
MGIDGDSLRRHRERSEAIQNLSAVTVWIASLRRADSGPHLA